MSNELKGRRVIPTCHLRQVPIKKVLKTYEDGSQLTMTTDELRLQQWWTLDYSASDSYIEMTDGKQYPGEWRDLEIVEAP